jgi:glyoxylase I family protein
MTTNTIPAAVRLHHHAYVTTDQEATRAFYEEIVGLPLVATWTEIGEGQEYCHTFFGLADGGALAFFQFADQRFSEESAPPVPFSLYRHVALLVDSESQGRIRARAEAAGVDTLTLDHGFCKSLYVSDPNGLILEFTIDHPEIDKIDALRRESAHGDLARWLSGDHSSNNDWRWDS